MQSTTMGGMNKAINELGAALHREIRGFEESHNLDAGSVQIEIRVTSQGGFRWCARWSGEFSICGALAVDPVAALESLAASAPHVFKGE